MTERLGKAGCRKLITPNLWKWPNRLTAASKTPAVVWTPELGKWYGRAAWNGYFNAFGPHGAVYSDYYIQTRNNANYSQAVFFKLDPGEYAFTVSAKGAGNFIVYLMDYEPAEGGYVWSSNTTLINTKPSGTYTATFSVQEGHLKAFIPRSTDASGGRYVFTDIALVKKQGN